MLIRYEYEALHELTALKVTSELFSSPLHILYYKAVCSNLSVLDCYSPEFVEDFLSGVGNISREDAGKTVCDYTEKAFALRFKDWRQALHEFVKILKEKTTRRIYTHLSKTIVNANYGEKDIEEIKKKIREHQDKIEILHREQDKAFDLDSFLDETVKKTVDNIEGLNTGYKKLDKMVSGLKEGSLFVIAGRPGMGKTAFGACVAENTATYSMYENEITERGGSVLFISLEMGFEELYTRTLVRDATAIRRNKNENTEWR